MMHRAFVLLCALCVLCFPGFSDTPESGLAGGSPMSPAEYLNVLADAYPAAVTRTGYDASVADWFLVLDTASGPRTLYWESGRLLPGELRGRSADYKPFFFYEYPVILSDPSQFTPEQIDYLRGEGERSSRKASLDICPAFFDGLYSGPTRIAVEQQIERVDFLSTRVTVHQKIVPALKRVERRIQELAADNETVKRFTNSIQRIDGYSWRDIQDTSNRSLHSWALALDILPVKWGSKIVYWQWARAGGEKDWMLIPLSRRWSPPADVIGAFESEGFIWGGKWDLWDNMHFEYRPEMILLRDRRGGGEGERR